MVSLWCHVSSGLYFLPCFSDSAVLLESTLYCILVQRRYIQTVYLNRYIINAKKLSCLFTGCLFYLLFPLSLDE